MALSTKIWISSNSSTF